MPQYVKNMPEKVAPTIEKLIKAFENGIKLARRVSRRSTFASAAKVLLIADSAQSLQRSLEHSIKAISVEYTLCLEACGPSFDEALATDFLVQKRLKELRTDLLDQINDCPDFEQDPNSFNPAGFLALEQHGTRTSTRCAAILATLREELKQEDTAKSETTLKPMAYSPTVVTFNEEIPRMPELGLRNIRSEEIPQMPELSSGGRDLGGEEVPKMPEPPSTGRNLRSKFSVYGRLDTTNVTHEEPWSNANRSQPVPSTVSSTTDTFFDPSSGTMVTPISPPDAHHPYFVAQELVISRINANDDFLERRRRSRTQFQQQIQEPSIDENNPTDGFEDSNTMNSPTLGFSKTTFPSAEKRSTGGSSGYDSLVTRERSVGQASQGTTISRTSSLIHKGNAAESEESTYGYYGNTPVSPPLSHKTSSSTDNNNSNILANNLKIPAFGRGIESGLEVVQPIDTANLPMVVSEEAVKEPTPAPSIKDVEYPMRHDASFYKLGEFCDGAKAISRGETGFKVVKNKANNVTTVSARCIKCSYEVPWEEVESDRTLNRAGIHTNNGIRWRHKFISKCHVKSSSVDEPLFACMFCVEDHTVVEEHDATIFFSITQLFRHLAKHTLPVAPIAGITTLYGTQPPHILDFDIHFTYDEPRPVHYNLASIGTKINTRASAYATTTHRPKPTSKSFRDPEGNPTLQYADGARIIGIQFPERFHGQYCSAYHDNTKGSVPLNTIALELPAKADVVMNRNSTLTATAKWDFKPRSNAVRDGTGWLKFSKGDRINHVGYTFLDQWCWTGCSTRGKWGVFPASFVEGLQNINVIPATNNVGKNENISPTSPTSSLGKSGPLGGFSAFFPLSRRRSSRLDKDRSRTSAGGSGIQGSPLKAATPSLEKVTEVVRDGEESIVSEPPSTASSSGTRKGGFAAAGEMLPPARPRTREREVELEGDKDREREREKERGSEAQGRKEQSTLQQQSRPVLFERSDRYM